MATARGSFTIHKADAVRARIDHATFGTAEAEAARLLAVHPDATFVIRQEVARVRRGRQGDHR